MKTIIGLMALVLLCAAPMLSAQRRGQNEQHGGMQVGGGHIPARGPAAVRNPQAAPRAQAPAQFRQGQQAEERRSFRDENGHPEVPHVHAGNDRWIGHDTGRNDGHYRVERAWEHGRFQAEIGPRHIYRLEGGGPNRFWFGGFAFGIAPYDVAYTVNWLWDTDDIVLYDDPDHSGWYLAYNVRLGTYAHVMYMGPA
jgi:hypothetical protein